MSNAKMLIDATHPEETRVVVQRNGRVEEFDFESAARKLLRGNIYLAKVTRVEPSLQAAFIDYGGNRHGFLAFNEIHPDYYQIPVADRQALIEEEAAAEAELEAAADRRAEALERRRASRQQPAGENSSQGDDAAPLSAAEPVEDAQIEEFDDGEDEGGAPHIVDVEEEDETIEEVGGDEDDDAPAPMVRAAAVADEVVRERPALTGEDEADAPSSDAATANEAGGRDADQDRSDDDEDEDGEHGPSDEATAGDDEADEDDVIDAPTTPAARHTAETFGGNGADHHEEAPVRPRRRQRNYKIQEVIKRRQIILVQVVKEERGNKGAALTTYLSLAGRYTVLMPNTARGGGISRKITNPQDRKRLKAIAQELEVPEGMGLIIRTAGAARTKQEIKRDFEYLLRLWESVRELTLQSTAPSLVYEEGDLIKRSIRDLYNKDVDEVVVAGDGGYQEAAEFMRMLMPSHARNVIEYKEPTPLFTRYGVERQLNAMFQPQVTLRSGGYIVINQTEALVAIDVNSGKSTREFSIEETALATNLEAAEEIARQLKLRDLAGLIVIDFIDMEEKRNNRAVERRLKDALRFDRARIQLGRISHFGLMEMSRQRLRTGVLEGSTSQCPHCQGTGIIRSTESIALAVLRGLEDAITAGASGPLTATTTSAVALYILNSKRAYIMDMEARHGHAVSILGSDRVHGANFTIERGPASQTPSRRSERAAVNMNWGFEAEGEEDAPVFEGSEIEFVGEDDSEGRRERSTQDSEEGGGRRRRRRRGRGRGRDRERGEDSALASGDLGSQPQPDIGEDFGEEFDGEEASSDALEAGESETGQERDGDERGARGDDGRGGRRRRRGRRGGRRGRDRNRTSEGAVSADGNGEGPSIEGFDGETDESAVEDFVEVDTAADDSAGGMIEAPRAERGRPERLWDVAQTPTLQTEADEAVSSEPPPARVQAEEASSPDVDEPAPAPLHRRHEIGSSEVRIERVVVSTDSGTGGAGSAEQPAGAQRKGWWQRRFGSQ